jgi:acyl carrier protein
MTNLETRPEAREHQIREALVKILTDMTADWELDLPDGIRGSTGLIGDLGCESIDIVMFIVAVEQRFGQKSLPFETLLMEGDRYVTDLSVDDVTSFLERELL